MPQVQEHVHFINLDSVLKKKKEAGFKYLFSLVLSFFDCCCIFAKLSWLRMQREGIEKDRMTHVARLFTCLADTYTHIHQKPGHPVADLLQFRDSIYFSAQ